MQYDPAKDDVISTDDVDVIVMKNGRPDMKHFQRLMDKQVGIYLKIVLKHCNLYFNYFFFGM